MFYPHCNDYIQAQKRAPSITSATHVELTHMHYTDEFTPPPTHTHTDTHSQSLSLSPPPLGKQSPASAAKLPKLSHLLMGYLSPCVSASLSTLMSFCSVCVCLPLCLPECLMSCLYVYVGRFVCLPLLYSMSASVPLPPARPSVGS